MDGVDKTELLEKFLEKVGEISYRVPEDASPQLMAYKLGQIYGISQCVKGTIQREESLT